MKNDDELKSRINLKNSKICSDLQRDDHFDTRAMIDAARSNDKFCANWFGPDGYKEQISRLGTRAHKIINEVDFSMLNDEENRIYDLLAEVTGELLEPLEGLENLYRTTSKREDLFPDDEEFEDE